MATFAESMSPISMAYRERSRYAHTDCVVSAQWPMPIRPLPMMLPREVAGNPAPERQRPRGNGDNAVERVILNVLNDIFGGR